MRLKILLSAVLTACIAGFFSLLYIEYKAADVVLIGESANIRTLTLADPLHIARPFTQEERDSLLSLMDRVQCWSGVSASTQQSILCMFTIPQNNLLFLTIPSKGTPPQELPPPYYSKPLVTM